ncbi:MAG: hypothetical protein IPM41_10635 [Sphingomonadales bacterium]|jgi:hypothetical protein|nr:hypothetical protein [Sphingomonadales bacterium]
MEIKRAIAAAERAGIEIDSVEIHPRKITIHSRKKDEPELTYAEWKKRQQTQNRSVGASDDESDAPSIKTRR